MDDDHISNYLNNLSLRQVFRHTWVSSSIVIILFSFFISINTQAVVWIFVCSAVASLVTSFFVRTQLHQMRIALSYCILGIVYKLLMVLFL